MASKETPNYRLSRWAGTDRILVEEFNDNWDKIDTALKGNADKAAAETAAREAADTELGKKAGLQLISSGTVSSDAYNVSVDLSNIAFGDWKAIYVSVKPVLNSEATMEVTVNNRLHGAIISKVNAPFRVILLPLHDAEFSCCGAIQYNGIVNFQSSHYTFQQTSSLEFYASSSQVIKAGTTYTIWGEK